MRNDSTFLQVNRLCRENLQKYFSVLLHLRYWIFYNCRAFEGTTGFRVVDEILRWLLDRQVPPRILFWEISFSWIWEERKHRVIDQTGMNSSIHCGLTLEWTVYQRMHWTTEMSNKCLMFEAKAKDTFRRLNWSK